MNEFAIISQYFRPLASGFAGSFSLTDDAAAVSVPTGEQIVVTKDLILSGVHFLENEDASLIARKLLRVNLSDLAAKGATPLCYFVGLALPRDTNEAWIAKFAEGLAIDQAEYAIHLAGGDTTRSNGPLVLSLTALGTVPEGQMLRRNSAKAGDLIYVSGSLGDAAFGLKCVKGELESRAFLEERYHLPRPRLTLGTQLRGLATACMDVSDGLVQDLGHIARESGIGARITAEYVPVSNAATTYMDMEGYMDTVLTGGDDYELLFTVPASLKNKVPLGNTCIGVMEEAPGVRVFDVEGKDITPANPGYKHF